jgi:predicted dehydrogenase
MKKLNVAIIGQGRSGRNIHGAYFRGDKNLYYNVKYIVEADEYRRRKAEREFEGAIGLADYRELFDKNDVDVVVNASYSEMHYPISLDLIEHGKNVVIEKPFGRNKYECENLIKAARDKGVYLGVFQQSFLAPYFLFTKKVIGEGKLGEIMAINIKFNGFARRWDWQTLQKKCAGGLFNTGPHPVGLALDLLGFDKNTRVVYSNLSTGMTSGDADDYAKLILTAPGKPFVDIEVSSLDAYSDYNIKIQGSRGTYKCSIQQYSMTYIVDGENPEKPVSETFIYGEDSEPIYCKEDLIKHTEEGKFEGDAFSVGTPSYYEQLYYYITEEKAMTVTPEMAAEVISVISKAVSENPLPVKF